MTLAEVASLARRVIAEIRGRKLRGRSYWFDQGDINGREWFLQQLEADPDFNAGPELRALRERLEAFRKEAEEMDRDDPGGLETDWLASRLREIVEGK